MSNINKKHRNLICVAYCIIAFLAVGCRPQSKPGEVIGGSMAPTFLGEHLQVDCPACRFPLKCTPDLADTQSTLVCPNCGFLDIALNLSETHPPERVEILPVVDAIGRWDVIAFRMPDSNVAVIKRVVGLPTEQLTLFEGNLFVGGVVLHKPIAHQKEMRIPVNDSHFSRDRRWLASEESSGWQFDSAGYHFRPNSPTDGMDWIVFQPQRCYAHQASQDIRPAPIEDTYGFNQSLARFPNPTDDIFVTFQLEISPSSVIGFQFVHRSDQFEFQIDVARRKLSVSGFPDHDEGSIPLPATLFESGSLELELTTIDQQMIVLINGKTIFDQPIPSAAGPVASYPIKFGASKGDVLLHRVQIWRDIYYLPAPSLPGNVSETRQILSAGQSGYLVLGDNAPVSIDSRQWDSSEILAENILGRVDLGENN